jgi:hypothetical protein
MCRIVVSPLAWRVAMSLLIAATALEQRVAETASGRGFDKAIDDFVRLLGTVPDSDPRVMGGDDLAALRAIAETVIDHIERRIDARTDRRTRQVALAKAVYRIQQELENIDQWHRHRAGAVPIVRDIL